MRLYTITAKELQKLCCGIGPILSQRFILNVKQKGAATTWQKLVVPGIPINGKRMQIIKNICK